MTWATDPNVFSEFRLIYGAVLILAVLHLIIAVWQAGRRSDYTLGRSIVYSLILATFNGVLFIAEKNTVTNHQLVPDQLAFYFFLAIMVLSLLAPIIYSLRERRQNQFRYRY